MMRIASLLALGVLACGTTFAAYRSESVTYIDGTIKDLAPRTGGVLVYSDEKALLVRTNAQTIRVPYATVRKADLGGTISHSHDTPVYKVWDLPKRVFPRKTQTQYLTVDFTNDAGEAQSMTLEIAESSAPKVMAAIDRHKPAGEGSSSALIAADTKTAPAEASAPAAQPAPAAAPKPVARTASSKRETDEQWFDRAWKTPGNSAKWPQSGSVAAGGQE